MRSQHLKAAHPYKGAENGAFQTDKKRGQAGARGIYKRKFKACFKRYKAL